MPVANLSVKFVQYVPIPEKGRVEYWDRQLRKLALRVSANGAKSWILMYRLNGKQYRHTIGPLTAYSLLEARTAAHDILKQVGRGENPAFQKQLAKMEARKTEQTLPESVETAVRSFIELYAKPKNRGWKETERIFERHVLPLLGRRSLASIQRKDIIELLDGMIAKRIPYMANRVLASLRKFFNWCVDRDKIEATPIARLRAPGVERTRDRVLQDSDLQLVHRAFRKAGYPFGDAMMLMLLTGQRRDEVATMRWDHINLDKALWSLPRNFTKSDRAHEVPLSASAVSILRAAPKHCDYVFSTRKGRPICGFSKAKAQCDALCGSLIAEKQLDIELQSWRLHDLRRTFRTNMPRLGISRDVAELILNHADRSKRDVAAVYDRYAYVDEKRHAMEVWAKFLDDLCSPMGQVRSAEKRRRSNDKKPSSPQSG